MCSTISTVFSLFSDFEPFAHFFVIQAIEHTFHRRSMFIAESLTHIVQLLSYFAMASLDSVKVRV